MAKPKYLTVAEVLEHLRTRIKQEDQNLYRKMRAFWTEYACEGRDFFVVQMDQGVGRLREVFTVSELLFDDLEGGTCVLESRDTGETFEVSHVPGKLGKYPLFVSLPVRTVFSCQMRRTVAGPVTYYAFGLVFASQSNIKRPLEGQFYIGPYKSILKVFPELEDELGAYSAV